MHVELIALIKNEVERYRQRVASGYAPRAWILPEPSRELIAKIAGFLGARALAFEFGSGLSTVTLRNACAGVTSVEDVAEWLEKTEQLPGMPPKRAEDKTRAISLTRCHLGIVPFHSFNLDSSIDLLKRLEAADLIYIGSPPNPATREHALVTALEHAKVGALILIDDLEVRAARRFSERLARDNSHLLDFTPIPIDHILGLFRKVNLGPIEYHPTLREMVGAWLRR